MLGFVLSKMHMLLFAVGIAVVFLMFYNFVSEIGLNEQAKNLIKSNKKLISDQLTIDALCPPFKTPNIPDRLTYGVSGEPFFYDLEFSKSKYGSADNQQNLLILRVVKHNSKPDPKPSDRKVIAAESIATDAEIILIDPAFVTELSSMDASYDKQAISLYPRGVGKAELISASPNGYASVIDTKLGKKTLYIIPCSSTKEPDNCLQNILRVGCYKLKEIENTVGGVTDTTLLSSCFNITLQNEIGSSTIGSGGYISTKSRNYNWNDCKCFYPEITGTGSGGCNN